MGNSFSPSKAWTLGYEFSKRGFLLAMISTSVISCSKSQETSTLKIGLPSTEQLSKYASDQLQKDRHEDQPQKLDSLKENAHQSVSAQSTQFAVTRVMINVQGPGIEQPIVIIWDASQFSNSSNSNQTPAPPEFFDANVPRGANRLFQVLTVLEEISNGEDEGGNMVFLYGDQLKSINNPLENVNISLLSVGTTGNSKAQIEGRYLEALQTGQTVLSGPTDLIDILFKPANGKPPMIVDTQWVFGGWLNFFALKDVAFSYRQRRNQNLLLDTVTADNLDAVPGRLAKISVPAGYSIRNQSGTEKRSSRGSRQIFFGFYGPGSQSAQRACWDSTASNLEYLGTSATIGDSGRVEYNPLAGRSEKVQIVGGFEHTADNACPNGSGDFGVGNVSFRKESLNWGDSILGIRGPFRAFSVGSREEFFNATTSGSSLTLQWKYLPGVHGLGGVDGVGIFAKTFSSAATVNDRWSSSLAPCNRLIEMGYSELMRVPVGSGATPVETVTVSSINSAAWNDGRLQFVMCPYTNARPGYFDFALTTRNYGGGGGNSFRAATKILTSDLVNKAVLTASSRQNVASSVCTPINLQLADDTNQPAFRMIPTPVRVTVPGTSAPNTKLYQNPNCSVPSGGATQLNSVIDGYSGQQVFYVKSDSTSGDINLNIEDQSTSPLTTSPYFGSVIGSQAATEIRALALPTIYAHSCYPLVIVRGRVEPSGSFVMEHATSAASGNLPNVSNLEIYSGGWCNGNNLSGQTLQFAQGESFKQYWMRFTGSASTISIGPGFSGMNVVSASPTVQQPGPPVSLGLQIGQQMEAEACVTAQVRVLDANGRPTVTAAAVSPTFTFNGAAPVTNGGFYADQNCLNPLSLNGGISNRDTPSIPASASSSGTFYFRWPVAGTTVSLAIGSGGLSYSGPSQVSIGQMAFGRILASAAGTTFTAPATILGNGLPLMDGEPFELTLRAVSPLGNFLTNFSVTDLGPNGLNLKTSYGHPISCASPSWSGGVANLTDCSFQHSGNNYSSVRPDLWVGGPGSSVPFSSTSGRQRFSIAGDNSLTNILTRSFSFSAGGACQPILLMKGLSLNTSTSAGWSVLAHRLIGNFSHVFDTSSGAQGWYDNANCTTQVTPQTPAGSSARIVYLKINTFTSLTANHFKVDNEQAYDPISDQVPTFTQQTPGTYSKIQLTMSNHAWLDSCQPIMLHLSDANGAAVHSQGAENVTLTSSALGAEFSSNSTCSTSLPNGNEVIIPANQKAKLVFFKPKNLTNSGEITATGTKTGTVTGIVIEP